MKPQLKFLVGPSILNADLSNLAQECTNLLDSGADYLHLDVMDGRFVPNLTFGHPVVKCLRRHVPKPAFFDLHMMVDQPHLWVNEMADAGADMYTFHLEAVDKPGDLIRKIKEAGMRVGLALKPATPIDRLLPYGDLIDMALVMTVEPGFGGQKFMPEMLDKVRQLRLLFPKLNLEVDGGVGPDNVRSCAQSGANMVVSGSAVTGSCDPAAVLTGMKSIGVEIFHLNSH